MDYDSDKVKRLLKSELVKRGVSISELVSLLNSRGLSETRSSVTSKINRGTFSASFFLQCLSVIGCTRLEVETYSNDSMSRAAEPKTEYEINK